MEPLRCSSKDACAPLIVQMRSASGTEIFWLGPHSRPCMSVRVTMLWIAIIASNGPGG